MIGSSIVRATSCLQSSNSNCWLFHQKNCFQSSLCFSCAEITVWIKCQLLLFISCSVLLPVFVSTSLGAGRQLISCLYRELIRSWICIVLHHGIHTEMWSSGAAATKLISFPYFVCKQQNSRKLWATDRLLANITVSHVNLYCVTQSDTNLSPQ